MRKPFTPSVIGKMQDQRLFLLKRMELIRAVRTFFEQRGYWEVDTRYLVPTPGEEVHLFPLSCQTSDAYGNGNTLFLHTSPEFAMKKIMAAFHHPIFQLGHVWRNKEGSPYHSIEFTMLEWYAPHTTLEGLMEETEQLIKYLLPSVFSYKTYEVDLKKPFHRLSMQEAFLKFAGVNVLAYQDDVEGFARAANATVRHNETWEDLFFRLIMERIEPALAQLGPCFLTHWPISQAALARRSENGQTALRFELYIAGMELANAFEELTDTNEQKERFIQDRKMRQAQYGLEPDYKSWPLDTDLLDALAYMPSCSGIAVGFDRIVMLATQAPFISCVQW